MKGVTAVYQDSIREERLTEVPTSFLQLYQHLPIFNIDQINCGKELSGI